MPTTVEVGRRQVATEIRNRLDDFRARTDDISDDVEGSLLDGF